MPLHERLRPPTLELAAPKAGHGFAVGMAFTVLAAGFAFAMPRALQVSAEEAPAPVEVTEELSEVDPNGVVVDGVELDASDEDGDDKDKEKADNHGQVVSAAAHCEVKGKAHGELVSSIAQDEDATLEDVAAACAAAVAAAEAAPDDKAAKDDNSKSPKGPKEAGDAKGSEAAPRSQPEKDRASGWRERGDSDDDASQSADTGSGSDEDETSADDTAADDSDAGENDSKSHGKGHSKDKP